MNSASTTAADSEIAAPRLEHFPITDLPHRDGHDRAGAGAVEAHAVLGMPFWSAKGCATGKRLFVTLLTLRPEALRHPQAIVMEMHAITVRINFFRHHLDLAVIAGHGLCQNPPWKWPCGCGRSGAALQLMLTSSFSAVGSITPITPSSTPNPAWFIQVVGNITMPVAGINSSPER